jgi:hypothetical protein
MPMVRIPRLGPRGVLGFVMGIAAIFDLTGTTVYRTMREVMPPAPAQEDGNDPFRAAMRTIMTSYHDAMVAADDRATAASTTVSAAARAAATGKGLPAVAAGGHDRAAV